MKPRTAEHAMRQEVIARVQEVIKRLWPTAEVRTRESAWLFSLNSYNSSKEII